MKVSLALLSPNTADANAFVEFLNHIRAFGPTDIYSFRGSYNNIFNFPPPMIHVIQAVGFISEISGLPFRFWLRLIPSLADAGTFLFISGLLIHRKDAFLVLLLLAACPFTILVSGHEGNVDGLWLLFLIASIWIIERNGPFWLAGLFLGLALGVKYVPLMFIPALVLYLRNWRTRIEYLAMAAITFIAASMPYILVDPRKILSVVSYGSIYGTWGGSNIFIWMFGPPRFMHFPYEPIGLHATLAFVLQCVIVSCVMAIAVLFNRKDVKPPLLVQCGLIVGIFLFLTPGFGIQYLAWLAPFITIAGYRTTAMYYGLASLYLVMKGPAVFAANLGDLITMYACWASLSIAIVKLWSVATASSPPYPDARLEGTS